MSAGVGVMVRRAPSEVAAGDLLAVREAAPGRWELRTVTRTCDGHYDSALNCPRTQIWVNAGPGERDHYHQPEVFPMLIIPAAGGAR